jgi:acyl carrier protein phosphodiesterase
MNIGMFVYSRYNLALAKLQKRRMLEGKGPDDLPRSTWPKSLEDPTSFYRDCFRYFHQHFPEELKEHRAYFGSNMRGFGEDALHVMWHLLFKEFKPQTFLEIGVFRGQVVSLATMLARMNKIPCRVVGISPFTGAGDQSSKYKKMDYVTDMLANFDHFSLPHPEYLKAYSTDENAVALIRSTAWDMIYIDGNHDYDVVCKDWQACSESVKPGGIIVLDDSGSTTSYKPTRFSTAGIQGPSRLAAEIDRKQFAEILQVAHNRVFQKIPQ